MTSMTLHAQGRHQQRAIPDEVIDLLFAYGQTCNTREGEIYHFTRHIIEKLRQCGHVHIARIIEEHRRCYLVCCNGRIVTVGHRYKRLRTKTTCLRAHRRPRSRRRRRSLGRRNRGLAVHRPGQASETCGGTRAKVMMIGGSPAENVDNVPPS